MEDEKVYNAHDGNGEATNGETTESVLCRKSRAGNSNFLNVPVHFLLMLNLLVVSSALLLLAPFYVRPHPSIL